MAKVDKICVLEVPRSHRLDDLKLHERTVTREPAVGQVLVQTEAFGLNFRDLLVATAHDRWASPDGRVLGSDAAGTVSAVGRGCHRFKVGDRVLTTFLPKWIDGPLTADKRAGALGGPSADGVFAKQILSDESSLVMVPEYLTTIEAASLPVAALTAWHALQRANALRKGAKVLIEGAGGVSIFALQMALAAGADVIAVSRSDWKVQRLRRLGATAVLNSSSTPDWGRRVFEMADDVGVDVVIDIGGASTLNQAIDAVAINGTISVVGLVGGLRVEMNLADIFQKNLRLDGIETGSRSMLEEMLRWFERKRINPVIDSVHEFETSREAFLHLQKGDHFGKVIMEPHTDF